MIFVKMRGFMTCILLMPFFLGTSCDECSNCKPFSEEPFITMRFYKQADSTERIIIIDSINHNYAKSIRHFQDTSYTFKFPLDMHNESSLFQIVYRDTSNLKTYLTNRVDISYSEQLMHRNDNYVVSVLNINNFTSDFAKYALICKDTSNIKCISNEAVAKIYN